MYIILWFKMIRSVWEKVIEIVYVLGKKKYFLIYLFKINIWIMKILVLIICICFLNIIWFEFLKLIELIDNLLVFYLSGLFL